MKGKGRLTKDCMSIHSPCDNDVVESVVGKYHKKMILWLPQEEMLQTILKDWIQILKRMPKDHNNENVSEKHMNSTHEISDVD
ncbi:hypothetical protein DMENIID0001_053500 [Sergentomyia squamirostris]